MVEEYEGKDVFRDGVRQYLNAHLYGNATAEDFWNAQKAVSGKPVDKVMGSFVLQAGLPMLHFALDKKGNVEVSQERFFKEPAKEDATTGEATRANALNAWRLSLLHGQGQKWTVPVCMKDDAGKVACVLLKSSSQKYKLPAGEKFFYGNAGDKGYYRSDYDAKLYARIVAEAETRLTPVERIGLIADQWSMMRAERRTAADYMDLVKSVSHDANPEVVRNALEGESVLSDRIASEAESDAMSAWERAEFGPIYRALPPMKKGEPQKTLETRAMLFNLLGGSSDAAVIAEAHELGEKYLADPASMDASMGEAAVSIMIANQETAGDAAALYETLLRRSQSETDPTRQNDALMALAEFKEPELVQRTLELVADGKVRNQDSWYLLVIELSGHDTREQALRFVMTNWKMISAQLTESSGADVMESMGGFCTEEKKTELTEFFSHIQVEAATRAMKSAVDNINGCMELKKSQETSLHEWLVKQGFPPAK